MTIGKEIATWRSVKIGSEPRTVSELCGALTEKSRVINRIANLFLDKMSFADKEAEIGLVKASVRDLGFGSLDEAGYAEILSRAGRMNLGHCQVEAIAKLCLQDVERTDESYLIAMEPDKSDKHNGHVCVLRIFWKDGELWLGSASFPPEASLPVDTTLIFQNMQ